MIFCFEKDNTQRVMFTLKKCHEKLLQFSDERKVCGMDITFKDIRSHPSSTVLLCGIGLFFLLGRKIEICFKHNEEIESLTFGYDDGSETLKINV